MNPWLLVATILSAEARYQLPPGLLAAVVMHESSGRKIVVRGVGKGRAGCDVGEGQIHVPGCDRRRMRTLLTLSVNVNEAGRLLARSRSRCSRSVPPRFCRRSEWAGYNAGSPGWWGRVARVWRRFLRARPEVS